MNADLRHCICVYPRSSAVNILLIVLQQAIIHNGVCAVYLRKSSVKFTNLFLGSPLDIPVDGKYNKLLFKSYFVIILWLLRREFFIYFRTSADMKAILKIQKEKENVLRQYIIVFYASHLVFGGCGLCGVGGRLGWRCRSPKTTMIYAYVSNRNVSKIKSPLDILPIEGGEA